jgi:hypothetical protein
LALFTPRGLKIRLPRKYAFALIARLYPKTDAFRVLQLTEEVDNLPSLARFVATLIAFSLRLEPLQIAIVVLAADALFRIVHLVGLFIPPFTLLLPLSRVYSFIAGRGILLTVLGVSGFIFTGWQGVAAYVAAWLISNVLWVFIELAWGMRLVQKSGRSVTASERSFFHAFRLEANRLGAATNLDVSEDELRTEHWAPVFVELGMKWPVVVARFTDDTEEDQTIPAAGPSS